MNEEEILRALASQESVATHQLADKLNVPHQTVVGWLKSLECDGYVVSEPIEFFTWKISEEGQSILKQGSPEFRAWKLLEKGPMDQEDLFKALGKEEGANALKNGMAQKIFVLEKAEKKVMVSRKSDAKFDTDSCQLQLQQAASVKHVDPSALGDVKPVSEALKKRKLASLDSVKAFVVKKGPTYAPARRARASTDLTKDMLADRSWDSKAFKSYNIETLGIEPSGGQLHPLLKVRQEFREIFLELGFQEMETQRFVDSSFWNFDALFVPQKHPARDAQDTFFISKPEFAKAPPQEYLDIVHKTHIDGYKCDWSEKESSRNVLRTHTTAVSAYVLYNLAQQSPIGADGKRQFKPGRYFSIDRVFRNEEMDKTHLCEFHQVEGFIVDRNLSLAHMMHTLGTFFRRVGIEKLRFKPAYNPYTEPSMEIFGYHSGMKRWMEVGNSGIFRPEMLKPMGYDDDVSVIAWGLSLERPTMIKYGIKDIHQLFGHKVDLKFIRRSMIARY